METALIQLAIVILVFAALVAYLLIKIPRSYKLKFVLIPVSFALALYMGITIPNLLGYAYPGYPQGQFTYMEHTVSEGKIILLAKTKAKERLYSFPYNSGIAAELATAKNITQLGLQVTGQFRGKSGFAFPGLFGSQSKLTISSPTHNGQLPSKGPGQ